jgi:RNA polymerase sigma-70 factor (ECF subfamily)
MSWRITINMAEAGQEPETSGLRVFATTHWSVVLAAASDAAGQATALEQLCRTYWYPLYAYIRRRGHGAEDGQDLTQEFFARLLEKHWLEGIERNGSRFRSFLLNALNGFLANEHDRATAAKRGGGQQILMLDAEQAERRYLLEPATNETPAKIFERRWALTVLDQGLIRLKDETAAAGKTRQFERLNAFLSREPTPGEYAAVAAELGVSSGAVGVSVHRLRQRYRELVREEIASTVANPEDVETEMRDLLEALQT